jgi:lipopolysaccharide assembly protein A
MAASPAAETPPERQEQRAASPTPLAEMPQVKHHRIRRTRAGAAWVGAAIFAVILLLLLIFILENGHTVAISFLGARGHLPLGAALLLAAVLGVLLVAIPGTVRILQLRITARRHRRLDAATAAPQDQTLQPPPGNADSAHVQ